MIGETVFHYRILDKIGEGGMGVVYRAEDINLRRTVALKFLSPSSVPGGSTRERIMKEARAAASLDHQNICAIHEVEELDDKLFIVMAYCKGRTLGTLIRDERPGQRESLNILIQIAEGLGAAHEAGIIHRDIKPANVIVSDKGKVKIMDFGLAKQSGAETKSMTMAGAGTLAYMSPEQVRGDHVDPRSDIWSFGVLMYQTLTGRRPFEGDYDASVLYSIVNDKHIPAAEAIPELPSEICAIIERTLEKSPDDRYESMDQLRNDLIGVRNFLFGEPDDTTTRKTFFAGASHIFGWKLTSILAVTLSVILTILMIRYIIIENDSPDQNSPITQTDGDKVSSDASAREKADVIYSQGSELYSSGNPTKGITLIEHALEINPEHFEALTRLAVYYDWGGDYERAAGYIERAKRIAEKSNELDDYATCAATQAKVLHNWDLAIKLYEDYLQTNPEAAKTHIQIGYILSRYKGENRGALEQYGLFFKLDPENNTRMHAVAHNYTGTAWLYSGEFENAIKAFTKYREMLPDPPDPVTSLAGAYLFAGLYDESYRLYATLLRADAPPFTVYDGLGKVCSETGRLRESNEHYQRYLGSVTFKAQKVNGHLNIARNYLAQKDTVSFDRIMDEIAVIDPEAARACWLRGVRHVILDNDIKRARAEFSRLTALMEKPFVFEETSRHAHLRGLILLAEGRTVGAIETLKESARKSPRDFFFFGREYARVLLEVGLMDEAIAECHKLEKFNSNDPQLLMILCRAYSSSGDMVSAKEYYARTLEVLAGADEDFVLLIEFENEFEALKNM